LLLRKLWVLPTLYPFLSFFGICAIPSDMPFVFPMEEAILPLWLLVLISVLALALVVSSVILLVVRPTALLSPLCLLSLLVISLVIYVENLLVGPSL
jgi:hypothetical protein